MRTQFQAAIPAWLDRMGGRPGSADAMLAAYLLNPNASDYSLKRLQEEAGTAAPEAGKRNRLAGGGAATGKKIGRRPAASTTASRLLEEMEIPLAQVLARMENIGFLVEMEISGVRERLETEIEALQKQIYEEVGYEFNINSPKQLGDACSSSWGCPRGKRQKPAIPPTRKSWKSFATTILR